MSSNKFLADDEEENDFFFMANLFPESTGLNHVVWVIERAGRRLDLSVKVAASPDVPPDLRNMAAMSVRPEPKVVEGSLPEHIVRDVARWIVLNEAAILDYWTGEISTADLIERLRKLEP